ncbi:ABC transporter ATP-binding protein/permease [Actinomycetaceae bacterium TAE3-ERU4]|nr:ABC transporter ATP-binding protein/permease [Actinomycetaceae bacterium TAE3-ERU4]
MDTVILNLKTRIGRMLEEPEILNKISVWAIIFGLTEGLGFIFLLPAVTSLETGQASWGLYFTQWMIVYLGLAIIGGICLYFPAILSYSMAGDMLRTFHRRAGEQISRLPLGWFDDSKAGRMSRLVSYELMLAGEIIAHIIYAVQYKTVTVLVIVVGVFFWDWHLGLPLLLALPLIFVILLVAGKVGKRGKAIGEPGQVELTSRIVEFAQCQQALRAAGQDESYEQLNRAIAKARKSSYKELWLESLANILSGGIVQFVVVMLIIYVGNLSVRGVIPPLMAIAFIGISLRFNQLVTTVAQFVVAIETRRETLNSMDDLLVAKPLPAPIEAKPLPKPGELEMRDVSFDYGAAPVLRNISFTVPPQRMCALVGPSGCGKTTIARLFSRFYDSVSGEVLVGGVPVKEQESSALMSQLSMVFQDVYLFDDTLEANIRLGREDATFEEIEEVARLAGVTEIIKRLPEGWKTPVGEGGRSLSGGERQRVSIARALLKNAPIVLLDEATSSLDPENEDNIVNSVNELRKSATILVIAHKLDTIKEADMIVSLNSYGEIEAIGTHEELMKIGKTYARFIATRAAAAGWQLS